MPRKFDRSYRILVDTINANANGPAIQGASNTRSVEVGLPFTCEFDLVQNTYASIRTLDLTVYNLSLATRSLLRKDLIPIDRPGGDLDERQIDFWAGYSSSVPPSLQKYYQSKAQAQVALNQSQTFPTVFRGIVTHAYSERQGTSVLTRIKCKDIGTSRVQGIVGGATGNGRTYTKGTPVKQILTDLISDIPRVTVGAIGNFTNKTVRALSLVGDPVDAIFSLIQPFGDDPGAQFFIYQQKAYILRDNEYLKGPVPVINAQSGLIGTPELDTTIVRATMLFEPGLIVAQGIQLETETYPALNGFYKIIGIHHRGMISPTVCGSVLTTVEMTNYSSISTSNLTLVTP